jgi:hypothetical protein
MSYIWTRHLSAPTEFYKKNIYRYDDETKFLVDHVEKCFEFAIQNTSKVTQDILNIEGMSGKKTRHFYNNLLSIPNRTYLEVGTWKGSTLCSAMYNNEARVVCIDNWSEFNGPKDEFLANFYKFKGKNDAMFIENDCFNVDVTSLPIFDIYLYDGDHKYECHYKSLIHFWDCLDKMFIYIVDDWNWEYVRNGTYDALKSLKCEIVYEREIRTTNNNTHPQVGSVGQLNWHNGIGVFVIKKL